MEIKGLWAFDW